MTNEKPTHFIGKLNYEVQNIANEYHRLAREDEEVGRLLFANHKYRHSVYCFVQAMEKHIRFKIFTLVNADHETSGSGQGLTTSMTYYLSLWKSSVGIR